jgi:hypothetical protein
VIQPYLILSPTCDRIYFVRYGTVIYSKQEFLQLFLLTGLKFSKVITRDIIVAVAIIASTIVHLPGQIITRVLQH